MAYVGGKSKNANHIINLLNNKKYDGMNYIEPFVGYAHILRRVINKKSYTASDANGLVYSLLKGIQDKTTKYPSITKRQYYILKEQQNESFKRAIAAFCYSYNGKEFGGYTVRSADGSRSDYPSERKRYYDSLRDNPTFMRTKLLHRDYKKIKQPKGKLIYCDPPYQGTTGYGESSFNHDAFWDVMRRWSKSNIVFISEYNAPRDFKVVAKDFKRSSLSGVGARSVRVEKVFSMRGGKFFE